MDTSDMLKQYEGYYTIGGAHEKLKEQGADIPIPTIRNWVNEMHNLQLHTVQRSSGRGERIFYEIDIEIIRFIHDAKKKFTNSMTMTAICTMIQQQERFKEHLSYNPIDSESSGSESSVSPVIAEQKIREFLKNEIEELHKLKIEMRTAKEHYEQQLFLLPDPETERKQREVEMIELNNLKAEMQAAKEHYEKQLTSIPDPESEKMQREIEARTAMYDARTIERRIKAKLRAAAEVEWNKNPVKRGFIFKNEDSSAKLLFIEKYIDDHIEAEMNLVTQAEHLRTTEFRS